MPRNLKVWPALFLSIACALSAPAAAGTLYAFKGGSDGLLPFGPVIADNLGNLFGTTARGGGATGCIANDGCGTGFELMPDGTERVLYAFKGGNDGATPMASLLSDNAGNLYGTTELGGASNEGTVFKVAPDGTETQLYAFKGGSDGEEPLGALIMDSSGDLYGTTAYGGGTACGSGCGTVFEIPTGSTETVLYSFQGGSDGSVPGAGLIADDKGNLYGTTAYGGGSQNCGPSGCGTIFMVAPDGTETVLYAFQGGNDGYSPTCSLVFDGLGNLYGTTQGGGSGPGSGTVFKLAPDDTKTVIHSFRTGNDGDIPKAGVIMDTSGNLYGTTYYGGGTGCHRRGCGTVFKVAPNGHESVLFAFRSGRYPAAGLLLGQNGFLYGTTTVGGPYHDGVLFRVKK